MQNKIQSLLTAVRKEISSHVIVYLFLTLVLLFGLFVRTYRTSDLMGFYYDQGRDALVIWKFWHEADIFLVGPVTGLGGIFLGPLYYFLIAPFYLIGGGNPSYPAAFLAFLSVVGIFFLYLLGWKMHTRITGLIAATIASFSYYLVLAGRWLANPTSMLLTSMLLMWSMWKIVNGGSRWWWFFSALIISVSLQLEAASAVFYIPMFAVFGIWQREKLPDIKVILISAFVFLVSLIPQVAFNFIHDNILLKSFQRVLFEEKSFSLSFSQVLKQRRDYFWSVFYHKIFPSWPGYASLFSYFSAIALLASGFSNLKRILIFFAIYLGVPMLGFIAFQGNYGNIYDYYMTGYYYPMILLFSLGIGVLWKSSPGKIVVIFFFTAFLMLNGRSLKNYLSAGVDGPTHITLGNELQAVNWVFEDREKPDQFNVDVYVPPVIPHSFEYLFLWQGTKRCGENQCGLTGETNLPTVYVVYEVDPPHPERLSDWLSKYIDTTIIEEEKKFGGVTVQRRKRI